MLVAPSEGNDAFYQNIERDLPDLESHPSKEFEEQDDYQHRKDTEEEAAEAGQKKLNKFVTKVQQEEGGEE
jgi:hypothetical protein